jgi:phage shock protein PspC (stress-responsive transcriptional regulator)
MKRTLSIQLGHRIFQMDDLAYERLKIYLESIEQVLRLDSHKDEIIADIEMRVGEIFDERLANSQRAIDLKDVLEMIGVMGQPEQYAMEEDKKVEFEDTDRVTDHLQHDYREIYRDTQDSIIGGVCSGLSHYLRWDPLVLRIVLVILMFLSFGTAFIAYLIAWALIPPAHTTAERLRMRGSEVNLENIQKMVKDESLRAAENVKRWSRQMRDNERESGRPFVSGIGKMIVVVLGGICLLFGLGIAVLLMGSLVITDFQWWDSEMSLMQAMDLLMPNGHAMYLIWGTVLVIVGPALSLMYTGVKWIFGLKGKMRWLHGMTTVFFILGLVMLVFGGWLIAEEFDTPASFQIREVPQDLNSDTLFVDILPDPYFFGRRGKDDESLELFKQTQDSRIYGAAIEIELVQTERTDFYIEKEFSSHGSRLTDAGWSAKQIQWKEKFEGNHWKIDPFISTPLDAPYRGQKLRVSIFVPVGKYVCLDKNWGWLSWREDFIDCCVASTNNGWEKNHAYPLKK